jgi:hypothetical protein
LSENEVLSEGERRELVPVNGPQERQLANPLLDRASWPVATNIPSDADHADMLIAVSGPAAFRATHKVGQPIDVQWYYCHWIERVDRETGEATLEPRLLLFGPDRQPIVSSGNAVREAFGQIIRFLGNGPWDPPIKIQLESVKGASGFDYHILRYLPPARKGKGK